MIQKNIALASLLLGALLLFASCEKTNNLNPNVEYSDDELYLEAIKDAMVADPEEISTDLIAIDESNNYLNWNGTGNGRLV